MTLNINSLILKMLSYLTCILLHNNHVNLKLKLLRQHFLLIVNIENHIS